MSIKVLQGGLLTTVQDGGRHGFRQDGVSVCGALDEFAMRAANTLVGNAEGAAVLEITLAGCALRFSQNHLIAICGGDLTPHIAGETVPCWRPIFVAANAVLNFTAMRAGYRAYLSVAGGLDVPVMLGSRSTDLRAKFGGYAGRALQTGDSLSCFPNGGLGESWRENFATSREAFQLVYANWFVSVNARPSLAANPILRVIRGSGFSEFDMASHRAFFEREFVVKPESNRMAYRLRGDVKLNLVVPREQISTAVAPGTIQIPPDGNPILLLADCQTTGGYPVFAHVIRADLPLVAQMKPGDSMRFVETTLDEAHRFYLERERTLAQLRYAVRFKTDEPA
jgi:antagonist of KipI